VIVIVGQPYLRVTDARAALDGPAARIAMASAQLGCAVQLVGTAGEDDAGDELVLELGRAGVGHVALLRKAGQRTLRIPARNPEDDHGADDDDLSPPLLETPSLDAGDVDLALRYLPEVDVLVLAESATPETVAIVAHAARWSDARLIVISSDGKTPLEGLPDDAIVFEGPSADPDGVFAQMVGAFAAALDEGDEPGEAFRATVSTTGWARSEP
jgi:hypothetical protein